MDQSYWNGRSFVVVGDDVPDNLVSKEDQEDPYCEVCNFEFEPPYVLGDDGMCQEPPALVLGSLLDIVKPAKPAKRKGVAEDFEIVESVTRVITFEDDIWQDYSSITHGDDEFWEEWDEAYQECEVISRKENKKPAYSAVVEKEGLLGPS
ncbi:hypothetical protein H0H87_011167 [Tephrocybe sp. NHM501043]|nr:hypothetical protein H0H87_011167 [Tephrocybe sp. NHM501043]